MEETLTANGYTYTVPKMGTGASPSVNNEFWDMPLNTSAIAYCNSLGGTLPTKDELLDLYNSGAAAKNGWPLAFQYQSSSKNSTGKYYLVSLQDGSTPTQAVSTPFGFVTCKM